MGKVLSTFPGTHQGLCKDQPFLPCLMLLSAPDCGLCGNKDLVCLVHCCSTANRRCLIITYLVNESTSQCHFAHQAVHCDLAPDYPFNFNSYSSFPFSLGSSHTGLLQVPPCHSVFACAVPPAGNSFSTSPSHIASPFAQFLFLSSLDLGSKVTF